MPVLSLQPEGGDSAPNCAQGPSHHPLRTVPPLRGVPREDGRVERRVRRSAAADGALRHTHLLSRGTTRDPLQLTYPALEEHS